MAEGSSEGPAGSRRAAEPTGPLPRVDAGSVAEPSADVALMRAGALMSAGTTLSRLTGFVRVAVIAWAIGATESKVADTYNIANALPNIVYQLVLGEILATVFVPVFVEHIKTRDREESWRLASSILNLGLVLSAAFAAVTVLAAPWLIKLYAFNAPDAVRAQEEQVGAFFLRILMPQMIFYASGAVLTGLLNAHRRFAAPMFAPVLNNLIVIATFALFRHRHGGRVPALGDLTSSDKFLLAGGTTLGVIAMTMALWPFVHRLPGRALGRAFDWRHPAIRHVGNLAKYSFGYVIVNQLALFVVYALANGRTGGVTVYQQSWILYQLPYGIFAVSLMTALIPTLSEHHIEGNTDAVRREVSLGLRTTAFVVLPAAAGFIALAHPIIRLLLEHGHFGARSTLLASRTFALMAIGLGAYAAFQQLMRAFYAMQDTKTPFYVNLACNLTNVVTAFPLFRLMGVPGLGLSHAISYLTGALYGGAVLRRRLGGLDGGRLAASHARIGAAAAITGAAAWFLARALGPHVDLATTAGRLAQVAPAIAGGVLAYIAMAYVLRIEEFRPLTALIGGRFERGDAR